jgi:hypothetical protein
MQMHVFFEARQPLQQQQKNGDHHATLKLIQCGVAIAIF